MSWVFHDKSVGLAMRSLGFLYCWSFRHLFFGSETVEVLNMGVRMLVLVLILISSLSVFVDCKRPSVVNIGAVYTYNSTIGRVAKVAFEAAVRDINANSSVLGGTKLNLIMENSHCSVFIGSIGGMCLIYHFYFLFFWDLDRSFTGLTSTCLLSCGLLF